MSADEVQIKIAPEDVERVSEPSTESGTDASASDCSQDDWTVPWSAAAPVEGTLLIFDWDDTILPTTWIQQNGLGLGPDSVLTEEQSVQLQALAELAMQTLLAAKRHGKVIFVTNAEHGWVELSCAKFLPSLLPALEGVRILSARSAYEPLGVTEVSEWKVLAFESEISNFFERCIAVSGSAPVNVVSIGDASHERAALFHAMEHRQTCHTKSLKLNEKPALDQLLREHELISGCFSEVVSHDGHLDLCVLGLC